MKAPPEDPRLALDALLETLTDIGNHAFNERDAALEAAEVWSTTVNEMAVRIGERDVLIRSLITGLKAALAVMEAMLSPDGIRNAEAKVDALRALIDRAREGLN